MKGTHECNSILMMISTSINLILIISEFIITGTF